MWRPSADRRRSRSSRTCQSRRSRTTGATRCCWPRRCGSQALVGLLSIFPAYYVSWGRYTQLTGLLLLPPLIIAWLELLRAPARRLVAVLALLLAGLSMIHFVVLVFALCFMAVSGAIWAIGVRREDLWARLWRGAIGGALALALAGPWLWVLASRQLRPTAAGRGQPLAGGGIYNALDPGLLWAGHNRILIALALLAALWSVLRRWRPAAEQAGWVAALVVFANPWIALYLLPAGGATLLLWSAQRRRWLLGLAGAALLLLNPALVHLPYLALITNEAVVISLFIPIGVLIGGGAGFVWKATNVQTFKRSNVRTFAYWSLVIGRWSLARTACAAALAGAALWGAWDMRDVVNPSTVLATPADVAAIEWAAQHTPTNARFLINAAPWLVTGRGDDGGWWLLPLADRWTSTPPVIYDYGPLDYVRETQARTRQVIDFRPGREQQIYGLIDRERITYVYLGPNGTPLTPGVFPASQGFEKVYDRDGATIFAVHRP